MYNLSDVTNKIFPIFSRDGGNRPVGDLAGGNDGRVFDRVSQLTQAGAKDEGDLGLRVNARPDGVCRRVDLCDGDEFSHYYLS